MGTVAGKAADGPFLSDMEEWGQSPVTFPVHPGGETHWINDRKAGIYEISGYGKRDAYV